MTRKTVRRKNTDTLILRKNQLLVQIKALRAAMKRNQAECSHRLMKDHICPECDFIEKPNKDIKKETKKPDE